MLSESNCTKICNAEKMFRSLMVPNDALKSGWLRYLQPEFFDSFLSLGNWVRIGAGNLVYGIGAEETDHYGVASGLVRIHVVMNENEQKIALICGPGFWFGEFEFVTGSPRYMDIDAGEDAVLMRVRRTGFMRLAIDFPDA